MAGFFPNDSDDDFDIVDGKADRAGAQPAAPAPKRVPATRPQAAQPARQGAVPAPRPGAASPAPARQAPQRTQPVRPAQPVQPSPQRPVAPAAPRQPVPRPAMPRPAAPVQPAAPQRPVAPRVPVPVEPQVEEAYDYEDYEQEPYVEEPQPEAYAPITYAEPEAYAPPAPRRVVEDVPHAANALFDAPAPAVAAASVAVAAPKTKSEKKASGWGALLGLGGEKKAKASSGEKSRSAWAGGRRRFLIIQIALGIVVLLLCISGIKSFVSPPSGPSYEQVQSAARAALNDTGFPKDQGSATALGFARVFYSFDPKTADLRDAQLLQFVNKEGVNELDADYTGGDTVHPQSILDGPYVVSVKGLSASDAIATVSMTLRGATADDGTPTTKVIYSSIPLHYDEAANAISVSGSPTFVPPTGVGGLVSTNLKPGWEADDEVGSAIDQQLLPQFFPAWAASNSANLKNLLAGNKATTSEAKEGLHGVVSFVTGSVSSTNVAAAGSADSTPNHRRYQTTVTWKNDTTGAAYAQTYRGWILRQPSGSWTIEDIQNAASVVPAAPAADQ